MGLPRLLRQLRRASPGSSTRAAAACSGTSSAGTSNRRPSPTGDGIRTNDEPFPRSPDVLQERCRHVRRRARHRHARRPHLGGRLPQPLEPRQDRALDPRRELHRLVLAGRSTSRAASSPGRRSRRTIRARAPICPTTNRAAVSAAPAPVWYLYSGNRIKYPLDPQAPAEAVARRRARPWRRSTPGPRSSKTRRSSTTTSQMRGLGGFVRAKLGREQRDHRRGERLHGQDTRPRPHDRLLAHPGDVDGLLRRRLALSVADRRRLHVVLRLVLRPAGVDPANLGRADRRSRKRRLVQFGLLDPVGLERSRRRARPTRISIPRSATRAPRASSSRRTTARRRNSPTFGCR